MNTDDRRVRKTKKALQEGLAELLLAKELRHITVRELTDTADVHRATFYAHYTDIYDLYEKMEDSIVEELSKIIVADPSHKYEWLFETLIDYVYDNRKMCRMLLCKNGNRSFTTRISTFLEEKYIDIWKYEVGQRNFKEEWTFFASYHIQGCLAVISKWVETGYAYPKDKIARIIKKIDIGMDTVMDE